jgi:hypothetical protein
MVIHPRKGYRYIARLYLGSTSTSTRYGSAPVSLHPSPFTSHIECRSLARLRTLDVHRLDLRKSVPNRLHRASNHPTPRQNKHRRVGTGCDANLDVFPTISEASGSVHHA